VGLDLNRNQGSAAGGARVQVRGANSMSLTNEPMFYVNGIRISARAGDMHSLEMIPASWVKQVRVLRGPSAQYPDAFNGVVLIETDPGRAP
jgi:outer membrane cobalamin receptor